MNVVYDNILIYEIEIAVLSSCTFPKLQPLHPCLLPNSARFSTLNLCTNPYEATVGTRLLLGHSGQPINDILLQTLPTQSEVTAKTNCDLPPNLVALRETLRWANIAPTCPGNI
jgi:DNA polymerase II small subunit/DNA polymerase delta subunit B